MLLLINAAYLAEQQQIPIIMSLNKPNRCVDTRSTTHDENTLTITSPIRIVLDVYIYLIFSVVLNIKQLIVSFLRKKIDIQFYKQIMFSENINFIFLCYIIVSFRETFQPAL